MSLELILGYTATIISLIVAIMSTIVSYRSLKIAEKSADAMKDTVDLFNQELEDNAVAKNMEFHYSIVQSIRELQLKFPHELSDPNYEPDAETERKIFVFWFLIFDEWFACHKEGKYLAGFWDKYYEKELYPVMKRKAFVRVLKKMVDEKNIGFFGQADEFSEMLNGIHKNENGVDLFDRFKK